MTLKEFHGELEAIEPNKLIDADRLDQFQCFFLILGLIFNDLKGLLFFRRAIENEYRKPELNEVSAHAGEYHGLLVQNNRLLLATVGEFFAFLNKNRSIVGSPKFMLLAKKMPDDAQRHWSELKNPEKAISNVIPKIARVRSNVVFHYDHSKEELRKGYLRAFVKDKGYLVQYEKAYISLGKDMSLTRFYFSDASAHEYMTSLMSDDDMKKVVHAIDGINHSIRALMSVYLISIK